MKIVTAGHRGNVATGDEIREVRNNKRRLFSYSLIILLSLCCGGFAAAAKLCIRPVSSVGRGYTSTPGATTWSVTGGVAGTISGESTCRNFTASGAIGGGPGEACWCRMTAPRTGPWVYSHDGRIGWDNDLSQNCSIMCAEVCGWKVAGGTNYLTAAVVGLF